MLELFRQCALSLVSFYMMMCRLLLLTAEIKLQSLKTDGCGLSSVIKIVNMKYKRIDIKL